LFSTDLREGGGRGDKGEDDRELHGDIMFSVHDEDMIWARW